MESPFTTPTGKRPTGKPDRAPPADVTTRGLKAHLQGSSVTLDEQMLWDRYTIPMDRLDDGDETSLLLMSHLAAVPL
jgi:hypothetical protein